MPRRGQPMSAEHKAKIAAAHKGRQRSPEHEAKLAAARQARRVQVDETRLRELAAQQMTCGEMAALLAVSEETVRRRMKALGIPRLPGKARMEKNAFWRGGRTRDKHGYWLVKAPGHPHATKAGYVREHRLVMEKMLGRYLLPTEVVDHIDGDTGNNDPSNLRLFASNADHLRATLAGKIPQWTPEGRARILESVRRGNRLRGSSRQVSGTDAQTLW